MPVTHGVTGSSPVHTANASESSMLSEAFCVIRHLYLSKIQVML